MGFVGVGFELKFVVEESISTAGTVLI
jgi:hypothetical protein